MNATKMSTRKEAQEKIGMGRNAGTSPRPQTAEAPSQAQGWGTMPRSKLLKLKKSTGLGRCAKAKTPEVQCWCNGGTPLQQGPNEISKF